MRVRTIFTFKRQLLDSARQDDGQYEAATPFGHDLVQRLIDRLRGRNVWVDIHPSREDFGWLFFFTFPEGRYCVVISCRHADIDADGTWVGWVERTGAHEDIVLGVRYGGISPIAVSTIHQVLSAEKDITDIRWHFKEDFERGLENRGSEHPETA